LENQKAKQIQGKAEQVAAVEKGISEKHKMIETLKKEIEAGTTQFDQLRNEVNDAVVKIETTNQQFVASFNLVSNQIHEDIEKIKTHV
jgi:predicted RNase H-like nuclease (RuvC/YqgF family)